MLKDAGYDITIASPNGGAVPIDPSSLQGDAKTPEAERMLTDGKLVGWLYSLSVGKPVILFQCYFICLLSIRCLSDKGHTASVIYFKSNQGPK